MNIDYQLLEKQRDHLLSILWHDFKPAEDREDDPVPLDRELGWGIVHLLDSFLDKDYYEQKNLSMRDKCSKKRGNRTI